MKKTKPAPVRVATVNIFDEIARMKEHNRQEQLRFEAMSDAEKAAYIEEERLRQIELEKILKQLRGPGFMELKI